MIVINTRCGIFVPLFEGVANYFEDVADGLAQPAPCPLMSQWAPNMSADSLNDWTASSSISSCCNPQSSRVLNKACTITPLQLMVNEEYDSASPAVSLTQSEISWFWYLQVMGRLQGGISGIRGYLHIHILYHRTRRCQVSSALLWSELLAPSERLYQISFVINWQQGPPPCCAWPFIQEPALGKSAL